MTDLLNYYFDSTEIQLTESPLMPECNTFFHNLVSGADFNIAIIGVPSEYNKTEENSSAGADAVRKHLYPLRGEWSNVRVCDLGNIKHCKNRSDIHAAVCDVTEQLVRQNILPLFIGENDDLTTPIRKGLQRILSDPTISIIDASAKNIPSSWDEELRGLNLMGYQEYYCAKERIAQLKKEASTLLRLGELRTDIRLVEPALRDTDFAIINCAALRQCDAPGRRFISPNGLTGEELCQIAHYAGLSDRLTAFAICGFASSTVHDEPTAALVAQTVWHFIEGGDNRFGDYPVKEISHYQKLVIPDLVGDMDMVFYRNPLNKRLWITIPTEKGEQIFACSEVDYSHALSGQIPDIWLRYFMK